MKLGIWDEELLAGTPTPHAAVVLELLRQVVLKEGVVMLDLADATASYLPDCGDWDDYIR